jgi:acetylornithine deacetylase/succinyl-diaminopimelate desuccinylase-like protein
MESPGEEYKVVEEVASIFDAHNIPYQIFGEAPRQDIVGVIGKGEKGYRRLIIPTHSDVVPAGKGWTEISDPFTAELKDGDLIGRGVIDNKGPMAAALAQAIILKQHEEQLPGAVLFAMVHDEEVGDSKGLRDLVSSGTLEATDAIVPDVGENLESIVSAEKGLLHVDVIVKGRQGHGSMPHVGLNAINGLAEYIGMLEPYTATPPRGTFLGQKYSLDQRFEDGITVNVGMISGGDAVNMVAAEAKASFDIRFVPELQGEQVLELLRGAAGSLKARGYEIDFQVNANMAPHSVPDDAAVIQAIQKYANVPTKGIGGRTVCGPLQEAGVTSIS